MTPPAPTAVAEQLAALVATVGAEPASDGDLHLSSLQVVMLVAQLETTFDIVLTSRDVTRKNFRTVAALGAMLATKVTP